MGGSLLQKFGANGDHRWRVFQFQNFVLNLWLNNKTTPMKKQRILEKLGSHMYRLHNKWDGTSEMLDWLKENGFVASSDGSDDYYRDFEENNDHFNFGASMSECFQVLCGNQHFNTTFCLSFAMGNKDAKFGKQLAETIDSIDLLLPLIRLMRIDNFMYLIARNYNKSLGDQAKEMFQKLDKAEFIKWAKGVVEPRFSGGVTLDEIRPYLIFDENPFKGINFLDAFYGSWCCAEENEEALGNWMETNEIRLKNPAEVFNDCFLHPNDETTKLFALCYWFGGDPGACHLFSMLNSQDVSIGVKTLLRNTLTDYGKGDVEFAKQLQVLYDQYRTINGGREINFVQQMFVNESFAFPEDDIEYHLSHDLYDENKNDFIGVIKPTYNDPENLTFVFKELIKFKWVRPDELDTFVYRCTGQRKPNMIIEKIHWDGPIGDLLYLFKKFYGGSYGRIELFFDVKLDIAPKYYSSYADRPSQELRDVFEDQYGIKNA